MRTKSAHEINVYNAFTVAYSRTVLLLRYSLVRKFVAFPLFCYFVTFNKVVDVIEQKSQLRRPEVIFPKLVQNTWKMGTNHGTKFMKEMKKPLLFGVGCPGQKDKRLFYHVDDVTTLAWLQYLQVQERHLLEQYNRKIATPTNLNNLPMAQF